ncbi:MAG: hypothetical protein LBQ66_09115 [Planctomycetaceae bacterium]|jgi:chromosome segregation ATPase|nr:hypothetical protein [Planctomycetaceae bacterium]
MNNNNVADISVFESLQANQHAKTGMSQMSVFNVSPAYKRITGDLDKDFAALERAYNDALEHAAVVEKGIKTLQEYKKLSDEWSPLVRIKQADLTPEQQKRKNELSSRKESLDDALSEVRFPARQLPNDVSKVEELKKKITRSLTLAAEVPVHDTDDLAAFKELLLKAAPDQKTNLEREIKRLPKFIKEDSEQVAKDQQRLAKIKPIPSKVTALAAQAKALYG